MRASALGALLLAGCSTQEPRLLPPPPAPSAGTLYILEVFRDFLDDGGDRLVHAPKQEGGPGWTGEQGIGLLLRWADHVEGTRLLRADRFELGPDGTVRLGPDEPILAEETGPDGRKARRMTGRRRGFDFSLRVRPGPEEAYVDVEYALARVEARGSEPLSSGRNVIPRRGALIWLLPLEGERACLVLAQVPELTK